MSFLQTGHRVASVAVLAACLAFGLIDGASGAAPIAPRQGADRSGVKPAEIYIPATSVETPHFRIFSSASAQETVQVKRAVESLHTAYESFFSPPKRTHRYEMVLYKSQAEFKQNNRSAIWAEAYYQTPRSFAYPGGRGNPYHWMLHEVTHQLLKESSGFKLEPWINEGTAAYFGSSQLAGGRLQLGKMDRRAYPIWWLDRMSISDDIQHDIDRGDIIPLKAVVGNSGPSTTADVNRYYLHCWSLVHFMIHGDGGKHRGAFIELVARGGKPSDFVELIGSFDEVQPKWHRYLYLLKNEHGDEVPLRKANGAVARPSRT